MENLHAEVEIAEAPRHPRRLFQGRHRNFQHFFWRLFEDIVFGSFDKKMGAMRQRLVEVKAKFLSVLRHAAPPPLSQGGARGQQPHMMMMSVKPVMMR